MTVNVFQIGCRGIGRKGFEKLLGMDGFAQTDVRFQGVYCYDFDAEDAAGKFAEAAGKEITFFDSVEELYSVAEEKENVLIYDAGPPQKHSDNIIRSLKNGFHHLTERPPSVTREEHVEERKMASKADVSYKVDMIERESPVVKKAKEIIEDKKLGSIKVFRESTFGVQKLKDTVRFSDVRSGCILDKMSHELFATDLLDTDNFNFVEADKRYFMPKKVGGEKLMRVDGSSSRELDEKTATGMCKAVFKSGDTDVELFASWLGLSEEATKWDKKVEDKFGLNIAKSEFRDLDGGFRDEECRFFVVGGSRKLLGDLMNDRLLDLEEGKEIEVEDYQRSQLYRVLEKAILDAARDEEHMTDEEKVHNFMHALFDARDAEVDGDVYEEIEKASRKIKSLTVSDTEVEETFGGVAK